MARKLKVGFIGTGRILTLNAMGYLDNPDAEIYALCDKTKRRLKKAAAEYGVKNLYTDYQEMLKDPDIDIIEVLRGRSMTLRQLAQNLCVRDTLPSGYRKALLILIRDNVVVKQMVGENGRFYFYLRSEENDALVEG